MSSDPLFIGIDVGTGSARAGIVNNEGKLLGHAAVEFPTWNPAPDYYLQSSNAIWASVCAAVKEALESSGVSAEQVKGIGFDATCSLVALGDDNFTPVTLDPHPKDAEQNIIVWMDHRAVAQAERINSGGHDVLKYVGNTISPEMETPKLLWVKENMPESFESTAHWLDLADYLVYRASGSAVRSQCTTVCKWTFVASEESSGWDDDYLAAIGLGELVEDGHAKIGGADTIRPMGESVGSGLTAQAASELGLCEGTSVGVGMIDAHAGALGMLGAADDPTRVVGMICGTSTCHLAVTTQPLFVSGVWGPYYSVLTQGTWLNEGGQSATGSVLAHVVKTHPSYAAALEAAGGGDVFEFLNGRVLALAEESNEIDGGLRCQAALTSQVHVYPDFHGNRSPLADPHMRAVVCGLTLNTSIDELARLYYATIQGLAYQTADILTAMDPDGRLDAILMCGGMCKNELFVQEMADVTGKRVVMPAEPETVLIGAAILGAMASGEFGDRDPISAMGAAGETYTPAGGETAEYHAAKYAVFAALRDAQLGARESMGAWM